MWFAVWPGVVTASMVKPLPLHHLAVGERAVRPEVGVVGALHARRLADVELARRPVRTFGQHQRAGRRLHRRHAPANDRDGCG